MTGPVGGVKLLYLLLVLVSDRLLDGWPRLPLSE